MDALPEMILEAVTQHIPDSSAWVPYAGTVLLALFGAVLMFKGAKLAPLMSACALLGAGGIAGSFIAHWLGTPVWLTIGVTGVIGFVLGLTLFKVWLAVLIASCFIAASLSLYGVRIVSPHVADYVSQGVGEDLLITMPEPGAPVTPAESPKAELAQWWSYASQQVPSFQTSFWAIVVSTGLAGLVFGLLLPRGARALFAASAGTFCFLFALTALLKAVWPGALAWLTSQGAWTWLVVGVVWGVSFLYNVLDVRSKRPKKATDGDEPRGKAATA